jgi:hypothetical protein
MTSVGYIILTVAFALVVTFGTIGNLLVCLVVLLNRQMRTPMNYLLVNLAISDMMLLVFFSPTFVFGKAFVHPTGQAGDYLCLFITGETLAWMGGYASAIFLLAIAVERYYAVANPHSYGSSFITKHLKLLVTVCWACALAWNVSGFATKHYDEKFGFCNMKWPAEYSFKVYAALSLLAVGFIPCFAMVLLYSRVVYTLWFKKQILRTNHNEKRDKIRRKKATKMVLSVSLMYALCWIPELTIFNLVAFAPQLIQGNLAYPASVAMVSVNSAVNPILYSLHNNQFRRHLKRLVCCRRKENMRISDVTATQDRADEKNVNS